MADWCSTADVVTHKHPPQGTDLEVLYIPSTFLAVVDKYDVDLDVIVDWDLSDVLQSGEIDIHSSLPADLTVIRNKGVEHSLKARTTVAGVF